jgi:hypothetical protein
MPVVIIPGKGEDIVVSEGSCKVEGSAQGSWSITSNSSNESSSTTREFTVEEGYSVLEDQVISVDPVSGNAIPGYTFPGSTSLPMELADLDYYFVLDTSNKIVVGATSKYTVLVQLSDDGVTRPIFGDKLFLNSVRPGDVLVEGVRVSTNSYALLFKSRTGKQAKVVAFKTIEGSIVHPADAESDSLGITLTGEAIPEGLKTLTPGGNLGSGELVVGFNETGTPNGGRDLVLQRFLVDPEASPPTLVNFSPQVAFTTTGTENIGRGQSRYRPPARLIVALENEDGTTNDLLYIRRDISTFVVLSSFLMEFTAPTEFATLQSVSAVTVYLTGSTSGRYKTYKIAGDGLVPAVGQEPIFTLPGTDRYTGDLAFSNLPVSGKYIATATINSNTAGIVYGVANRDGGIDWGAPVYNQLPRLKSPAYVSETLSIAAVHHDNSNGSTINGLTNMLINPETSTVSLFRFEGPYPIAISTQAGVAGETVVATVYGLHNTSTELVPGQMYFADTDGFLRLVPQSGNVQYKSTAMVGAAITPNSIHFSCPISQSIDFS